MNAIGRDVFGWTKPIPFLSQRAADVSLLGPPPGDPGRPDHGHRLPGVAIFPVRLPLSPRAVPSRAGGLDEAARVDGASPTQRFRYILLPQLSRLIGLPVVLRFIWTFNEFDDIYC